MATVRRKPRARLAQRRSGKPRGLRSVARMGPSVLQMFALAAAATWA